MQRRSSISRRHPEARVKRASNDARPGCGRRPSRLGLTASHLRMTEIECARIIVLARHLALRGLPVSLAQHEGAERRQALGCLRGTRSRASNAGPQARSVAPCVPSQTSLRSPRIRGTLASRRSTAAIYWRPTRLGEALKRCTVGGALELHVAHSRVPLVVAEGRCRRAPPGGVVTSQPAGRRIPFRLWLVSGDALDERDARKIVTARRVSNFARSPVNSLLTHPRVGAC